MRDLLCAGTRTLTLLLATLSLHAHAQAPKNTTANLGWGSSWTAPVDEHDRQRREFIRQCETASSSHNYLGVISLCNQQLQKEPNSVEALVLRANAAQHVKHYDQALADVDHAREIAQRQNLTSVSAGMWNLRAHIHASADDYPASLRDLQTALKADKNDPEILNDLAWLRATAPDATVRDGHDSVSLARKAVALCPQPTSYRVIDTLAAAYAEASDYPRAVKCEKRALSDAGKAIKDPTISQKFQKEATNRIQLFEQNQPYHAAAPES